MNRSMLPTFFLFFKIVPIKFSKQDTEPVKCTLEILYPLRMTLYTDWMVWNNNTEIRRRFNKNNYEDTVRNFSSYVNYIIKYTR